MFFFVFLFITVKSCPYLDAQKQSKPVSLLEEFLSLPVKAESLPEAHQDWTSADLPQLITAVLKNDQQLAVEALSADGSALTARDEGRFSAFDWAVALGKQDMVDFFLNSGVTPQPPAGETLPYPPLHIACLQNHSAIVKKLLEHVTDIDLVSSKGLTALAHAADEGHVQVVELLVQGGADVNQRERTSRLQLPLVAMLAMRGEAVLVDVLLRKGADPAAKTTGGHTGLMFACAYRYKHTVASLVAASSAESSGWLDWVDKTGASALLYTLRGPPAGPGPTRSAGRPDGTARKKRREATSKYDEVASVQETVAALLKAGVSVKSQELSYAVDNKQLEVLELFAASPQSLTHLTTTEKARLKAVSAGHSAKEEL